MPSLRQSILLHDGTTDIFEDREHSGDLALQTHGWPAAVKEKAAFI